MAFLVKNSQRSCGSCFAEPLKLNREEGGVENHGGKMWCKEKSLEGDGEKKVT